MPRPTATPTMVRMVENREVNVSLATIEIPFIVLFLDQLWSVTGGTLTTKADERGA